MDRIGHAKLIFLLAHLWTYPEASLLENQEVKHFLEHLGFPKDDLISLQTEYVRLFINAKDGVPCPPYASYYLTGGLYGFPAQEAQKFYSKLGFAPQGPEPPDFLPLELAFVAKLVEQARQDVLEEFLQKHFLRWFRAFYRSLKSSNPPAFYSFLADLTKEVIEDLTLNSSNRRS